MATTTKATTKPATTKAAKSTPTPARRAKGRPATEAEGLAADAAAKSYAEVVAAMPPKERRRFLAEMADFKAKNCPSIAAAKSDLLKLLMVVGAEFVARYYPDATMVSFHVSRYDAGKGPPEYSVMIPLAVPAREPQA